MKKKNVLMAAVASLGLATASFAQNVPSYVPSNGLVGWWPFNGNANDESGNGNNGTVNGATLSSDRFGNANKAYSFDGISNEILVLHSNSLNILPLTISVWFKTINQEQNKMLVNKYGCQTLNGYSFNLNNSKSSAYYYSNGNGVNNYLNFDPLSYGLVSLNDSQWHHGVLVVESDSAKIYIDNILILNKATTGKLNITSTTENLHFAKYAFGNCLPIGKEYYYL